MREIDSTEIESVSGAGWISDFKQFVDTYVPEDVQLLGAIGTGALFGAPGGPIGAFAGGVAGGIGFLVFG